MAKNVTRKHKKLEYQKYRTNQSGTFILKLRQILKKIDMP